jgi:hypothetical protein
MKSGRRATTASLEGEVVLDHPGQLVDGANLGGPRLFGERLGSLAFLVEEVR